MNDKVILVTGASSGIGWQCAEHLAEAGWRVIGASRRGASGDGWTGVVMDVDHDESVATGVTELVDRYGRLDAVLACAGWGLAGAAESTPIADAKAQFETNFWGAVRVTQASLAHLRRQGADGSSL